jgi:radical SAM-linked protein
MRLMSPENVEIDEQTSSAFDRLSAVSTASAGAEPEPEARDLETAEVETVEVETVEVETVEVETAEVETAEVGAVRVGAVDGEAPNRMRIRFSKQGDLRLISHRDLVRAIERLFRRAAIDVRQSEGFHPKPRMMFPSALGLGIAGWDEVFEVDLGRPVDAADLRDRLAALVPPGLEILAVESVRAGARKARARSFWYELPISAERAAEAAPRLAEFLASASWLVERPGRAAAVDLRATLLALVIEGGVLRMQLLATHEAQARPRDILAVLNLADLEAHGLLVRTRVELDG